MKQLLNAVSGWPHQTLGMLLKLRKAKTSLIFSTLATSQRVWTRPSKYGTIIGISLVLNEFNINMKFNMNKAKRNAVLKHVPVVTEKLLLHSQRTLDREYQDVGESVP